MTARPKIETGEGPRPIGSMLDDVLFKTFSKMPRAELKALLMTPEFTADQRAYWFYVFNLAGD